MITRRRLLQYATLSSLSPLINSIDLLEARRRKFKIGACDWSIGKSSNIEAFELARRIGLDGLMISLGSVQNNLHLRERSIQDAFVQESERTKVKISSLGIAELNNVPYKSDPRTIQWVWDSIDTAAYLKAPVVLLAFFNKNDLRNDDAGKQEVIRRLKEAAPHAERNGVILGIESYLNAAEHREIIEGVGSKNVKAYIDFRNTADAGYDVFKEVRQLGVANICELHMKENGFLLGKGTLPWQEIRDLIYEMKYYGDGWMQIEWAMPRNADIVESYRHNLKFLRELFEKKI